MVVEQDLILNNNLIYKKTILIEMNESKGISNINKPKINEILEIFLSKKYVVDYVYEYNSVHDVKITFRKDNNYNGLCIMSNQKQFSMIFNIPTIFITSKIKETISHELNHLIELITIIDDNKNIPRYKNIQKTLQKYHPDTIVMKLVKDFLYKTLDNEINANVAQTYTYLLDFNIEDYNNLRAELFKYKNRIDYENLLKLNIKKLIENINKNNDSEKELSELITLFRVHKVDTFFTFINDDIDNGLMLKKLFIIGKKNIEKYLDKQVKLLDEVIIDVNEKYEYYHEDNENFIKSYDDYLKL